jgi:hypothetical protein
MSWVWLEQIGAGLLIVLSLIWSIVLFFHTITFPLSEEKTREIIREELKKALQDD